MKSPWAQALHDFDDIAERPPLVLSVPVVASFVILLMALALFAFAKKGTLVSFAAPTVNVVNADHADLEKLRDLVLAKGDKHAILKTAKIDGRAVSLVLQSDSFFNVGGADVLPKAKSELIVALGALRAVGSDFTVSVEGHTDSAPVVHHRWKYPTNWELSAARAAAVARLFEESGFPSERLAVSGYSSQRPKVNDRTPAGEEIEANKTLNRRVTLKLYPAGAITGKD